jgi:flagellar hook assembly protein FlgD
MTWFGTTFKYSEKDKVTTPLVFALSQSTPNPCKERTSISYAIPKASNVTLHVYNAAGQLVKTLVNGMQEPGVRTVVWNGQDENNRTVAQGVYFYRLTADNYTATRKLLIVR